MSDEPLSRIRRGLAGPAMVSSQPAQRFQDMPMVIGLQTAPPHRAIIHVQHHQERDRSLPLLFELPAHDLPAAHRLRGSPPRQHLRADGGQERVVRANGTAAGLYSFAMILGYSRRRSVESTTRQDLPTQAEMASQVGPRLCHQRPPRERFMLLSRHDVGGQGICVRASIKTISLKP